MGEVLIETILIIFELCLFIFVAYIVSDKGFKAQRKNYLIMICLFAGYFIIDILCTYRIIVTFKTLLVFFLMLKYVFDNSVMKSIFITVLFFCVICLSDILTSCIISWMANCVYDGYLYDYSIIGGFICDFIVLAIMTPLSFLIKKRIKVLPVKYWLYMIFSPVISCAILIMLDILLYRSKTINPYFSIIPASFLLYLNIALFRFFEAFSYKIDLEVLKQTERINKENYQILSESEDQIRILRHDMKNHLGVIMNYAQRGSYQELIDYIGSIQKEITDNGEAVYTKNPLLDAVINVKGKIAKKNDIRFIVKMNISEDVLIKPIDLCTILGNALDNAIESSKTTEDKFIVVSILSDKDKFILNIKNSADGIITKNGSLMTTKQDKQNHGLGIKSMKKTLKKYNGYIDYYFKEGVFTIEIIMENKLFIPC